MTASAVALVGCVSTTPHGRDQVRRLSQQARRRGLRLVGLDTADKVAGADEEMRGLVDDLVVVDVHDPVACAAWAAAGCTGTGEVHAVLATREMCVESAAAVAHALSLPGSTPTAVRTIRRKDLCRAALRAAGLRQPESILAEGVAAVEAFCTRRGSGPWIVKPRDGMGSVGISLVTDPADRASLERAVARAGGGVVVVEDFVDGPELSVEGVLVGGAAQVLAITAKRTGDAFVESEHSMPAVLEPGVARAVESEVVRALEILEVRTGVFHVEVWATADGVVLGEVHARPGGDFLHAMVEHVRPGLELFGAVLDDLLGRPVPSPPPVSRAAAARFLFLPPGTVEHVDGWDRVTAHPSVLAADLAVGPGDTIGPVTDSAGRHGVVVVGGGSAREVGATLDELFATLRVTGDR